MDFRTNKKSKPKATFKQYCEIMLKYFLPFAGRYFPEVKKVGEAVEKVSNKIESKKDVADWQCKGCILDAPDCIGKGCFMRVELGGYQSKQVEIEHKYLLCGFKINKKEPKE